MLIVEIALGIVLGVFLIDLFGAILILFCGFLGEVWEAINDFCRYLNKT